MAWTGVANGQTCVGDCDGDGMVAINELVLGVNIALGAEDVSACSALDDGSGNVTVDRLVAAVNSALCGCQGCAGVTATPTATGATPTGVTETPTATPTGATPSATSTGATPSATSTGSTATATPTGATPTPTATGGVSETVWTVDGYDLVDSDCNGVLEEAVLDGLEEIGPEFTVRRSGSDVEIEDSEGTVYDGTVDPDGTVNIQFTNSDSVVTCDYDVDVDAFADLDESPTTATYDLAVNLAGFCLGFDDCDMEVNARWRRLDVSTTR